MRTPPTDPGRSTERPASIWLIATIVAVPTIAAGIALRHDSTDQRRELEPASYCIPSEAP